MEDIQALKDRIKFLDEAVHRQTRALGEMAIRAAKAEKRVKELESGKESS